MSEHKIESASDALAYILAGKATVSLKSLITSNHYTFEVKRPKKPMNNITHFVSVRTGNDHARLGLIREGRNFYHMKKADLTSGSSQFRSFYWLFQNLMRNHLPTTCEIWHEGRCGMCARPLTDPESIGRGIGPDCFEKIQCKAA